MCERSRQAHIDYIKLAGLEGCSLYFEQLLKGGFDSWPLTLRRNYPALADWRGPAELKATLRAAVSAPVDSPVLVANRSAQLMRLAARALTENAQRLLVTDLTWPGYRSILERSRQLAGVGITTVGLRDEILSAHATVADVVDLITARYEAMDCDGVFLPVVSHLGIRLPLNRILKALQGVRNPAFVVVDGAQALGHLPAQQGIQHCDFFVGGCHKWLQGHVPMGVAFCPSPVSAPRITSTCQRMALTRELDDPLLLYVEQLDCCATESYGETVNLASLFSSRAALASTSGTRQDVAMSFRVRRRNGDELARSVGGTGWVPLLPQRAFRSGVLLLRLDVTRCHVPPAQQLREVCLSHGMAVTAYERGIIRLAMPNVPWGGNEIEMLREALNRCSNHYRKHCEKNATPKPRGTSQRLG